MKDTKINILGVNVNATTLDLAEVSIRSWISLGKKAYVCVVPVSTVVECQENPEYLNIVNLADMATPDGMPLVWLGRLKGNKVIQRTYGPDLMLKLCETGQKQGLKHYFYGGTTAVLEQLEARLKKRIPQLNIVGKFSPPFTHKIEPLDPKFKDDINRSKPDILWVALGSPKQDFWMHRHRDKLEVPVMIGVGAAFDFLAGTKKQAPVWMRRGGLEWFFRLCCEPKRLWKRYTIGNCKFIYYLFRDSLTKNWRKKT